MILLEQMVINEGCRKKKYIAYNMARSRTGMLSKYDGKYLHIRISMWEKDGNFCELNIITQKHYIT